MSREYLREVADKYRPVVEELIDYERGSFVLRYEEYDLLPQAFHVFRRILKEYREQLAREEEERRKKMRRRRD